MGAKSIPWIWGQINYWDIDRSCWRDVLRAYHELGHAVVSTAVLPRVHQLPNGQYDFTQSAPARDLTAFLNEVQQLGLKILLWVGPRDVPGIAAAGYPETLLLNEQALARNASDRFIPSQPGYGGDVFSIPCLISDAWRRELKSFSRALQPVIAPQLYPEGPVIGLGVTQAPGWSSAALSAFGADYHSEALAGYHNFLKKNYRKIPALNETYQHTWALIFEEIQPPRQLAGTTFPDAYLQDWRDSGRIISYSRPRISTPPFRP